MPSEIEKRFLAAIQKSHEEYKKPGGARSNRKLLPLHGWVKDEIQGVLGTQYEVRGLSPTSSVEDRVTGMYYAKRVDVSIVRDELILGVIGIKFINSNFRQNSRNYFEGQMGETANLRLHNLVFGHVLCTTEPIPYKKRGGKIAKLESFKDEDVERYLTLAGDHQYHHAPDVQAVCLFRLDMEGNKSGVITRVCRRDDLPHLSDSSFNTLQTKLSIERFFRVYKSSIEANYEKQQRDVDNATDHQTLGLPDQQNAETSPTTHGVQKSAQKERSNRTVNDETRPTPPKRARRSAGDSGKK